MFLSEEASFVFVGRNCFYFCRKELFLFVSEEVSFIFVERNCFYFCRKELLLFLSEEASLFVFVGRNCFYFSRKDLFYNQPTMYLIMHRLVVSKTYLYKDELAILFNVDNSLCRGKVIDSSNMFTLFTGSV